MSFPKSLSVVMTLSLFLWSVWVPAVAAQEGLFEIVEEIQSVPVEHKGSWTIGGHEFGATGTRVSQTVHAAEPGSLARVRFVLEDGKPEALEIEPLGIKAAEVTDGPYVFWTDATTAEVISFANGEVKRELLEDIISIRTIDGFPDTESSITLDPNPPVPTQATWTLIH